MVYWDIFFFLEGFRILENKRRKKIEWRDKKKLRMKF